VVIEVGTHSRWVAAELEALGHTVTVANPRHVKLISQAQRKSDKRDAELLARLGRSDRQLLSPVEHRGVEAQRDLAALKARDVLVVTRTRLVNFARGIVKSFGERLPDCDAAVFVKKARPAVPAELGAALTPVLDALEGVEKAIEDADQLIAALAEKDPDVEVVSQPFGVGALTALAFLRVIEDKTRAKKSRDVGPILGLTPKQDQSGSIDRQLGITKAGDSLCRRLLVQAAHVLLQQRAPDSDLKRWGLALAERGGKCGRKRDTIAVARKLALLMHRLWMTGEVYQPLGYRPMATA
jgi:transposase